MSEDKTIIGFKENYARLSTESTDGKNTAFSKLSYYGPKSND